MSNVDELKLVLLLLLPTAMRESVAPKPINRRTNAWVRPLCSNNRIGRVSNAEFLDKLRDCTDFRQWVERQSAAAAAAVAAFFDETPSVEFFK